MCTFYTLAVFAAGFSAPRARKVVSRVDLSACLQAPQFPIYLMLLHLGQEANTRFLIFHAVFSIQNLGRGDDIRTDIAEGSKTAPFGLFSWPDISIPVYTNTRPKNKDQREQAVLGTFVLVILNSC